jgi:hypothetical protein
MAQEGRPPMQEHDDSRLSKPQTKAGRLQREALAVLDEHAATGALPTSIRFVFYELEHLEVVRKHDPSRDRTRRTVGWPAGEQDLIDAIRELRIRGVIPWSWIADDTRELREWNYANSTREFLLDRLETLRLDCWDGKPPPLILCESRTFGGVLQRTLAPEYLCPIAATNGMVLGFLHTDIVPILENNERQVLYIGDLDLSGEKIEANTQRVLERALDRKLDWTRIALTEKQRDEHGLSEVWKTDKRYGEEGGKGYWAIEVEALGQTFVTDLIGKHLDDLLPKPLDDVQKHEADERQKWAKRLAA